MPVRVVGSDGRPPAATTGASAPLPAPGLDLSAWLRGLVWSLGPVAPATSTAGEPVHGRCHPGGTCRIALDVVNAHGSAVAMVLRPSVLRRDDGTTWRPATTAPATAVVGPGERRRVRLTIDVPDDVPVGTYRGELGGLASRGVPAPLTIVIEAPAPGRP